MVMVDFVVLVQGRPGFPGGDRPVELAGNLVLAPDPRGLLLQGGTVEREAHEIAGLQRDACGCRETVDVHRDETREHQALGAAAGGDSVLDADNSGTTMPYSGRGSYRISRFTWPSRHATDRINRCGAPAPSCPNARQAVRELAASRSDVVVIERDVESHLELARRYGVIATPAVVIDGDAVVYGVPRLPALAARVDMSRPLRPSDPGPR